jgi:hypothetical protein
MKAPLVLLTALFIASAHQTLSGETSGDWTYSVSDNQATITGYSGAGGAVYIPAVVDGNPVVKVGDSSSIFGIGNSTVTSVTIPDSVTSIGSKAFYACNRLTSITIPDSVTSIGEYAFSSCASLSSVIIGNSVTSIGKDAFFFCTSLTSITIPDSVTSIGEYAFYACTSLTRITVDADNSNYSSVDGVLFDKLQTLLIQYPAGKLDGSYTIDDSVTSIGNYAFYYCSSLASVTIPDTVASIGERAFSEFTSLSSITVGADNSNYSSVDGVLFNKLQTLLIQYPAGILDDSYTIPDSVTSIGVAAFDNCTSLTSLTIPDSVTSIGDWAFAYCSSLTSVTIPDSVTSIGDYAFYACNSLTSVTIPDSVTIIGDQAFTSCSSLTSVTIPDSVTSIGNYAFYNCTSLTSVTLPILFIDSYPSFSLSSEQVLLYGVGTSGDWTISVLDNQATITGYSGVGGAVEIPAVVNEISVVKVGNGWPPIFGSGNTTVTSVTIPDSVTSIGNTAFYNCSSLTSVTIPDSVTSIGSGAFDNCTSLTSVTLPAALFVEENYSDYSLLAEQVRVEKTSIDAFVANAETAARTTGQNDVTSDPATYSLYTASDVTSAEATSRSAGQTDVTASPSAYDLHTSTELAEATAVARTIVNVSARVNLGAEETVIPGFVVLGESKQLLIRAVGPKLADLGVPSPLPDPTMTIYRTRYDGQPNDVVAIIDDWKADGADVAAINAAMISAGAFPLEPVADFQGNPLPTDDTKSAATLITLSIGVYTVVVTSADGGEGDVLVEAYEIY